MYNEAFVGKIREPWTKSIPDCDDNAEICAICGDALVLSADTCPTCKRPVCPGCLVRDAYGEWACVECIENGLA